MKNICVFCGSSIGNNPKHKETAQKLGRFIVKNDLNLICGGSIGMMNEVVKHVKESSNFITVIIPKSLNEIEDNHKDVNKIIITENTIDRKNKMIELSDIFIVMPGGIGTLEELFEILALKQLNYIDHPIYLIGENEFWTPMIKMLDNIIDEGFLKNKDKKLFQIITNFSEIIQ